MLKFVPTPALSRPTVASAIILFKLPAPLFSVPSPTPPPRRAFLPPHPQRTPPNNPLFLKPHNFPPPDPPRITALFINQCFFARMLAPFNRDQSRLYPRDVQRHHPRRMNIERPSFIHQRIKNLDRILAWNPALITQFSRVTPPLNTHRPPPHLSLPPPPIFQPPHTPSSH